LVSQPLAAVRSQSAKPPWHARTHAPALQVGVALGSLGQRVPHIPQLAVSLAVSAQMPLAEQKVVPAGQELTQAPPAQREPAAQGFPQRPQSVLVFRLVSQPLTGLPSQSPAPALQLATVQRPRAHPAVALGGLQALPHAPQEAGLVARPVSQPLAALPSQLP
jgi:hypothetical protein